MKHPDAHDLQLEEFPKRVRLLSSVAKKERWIVDRRSENTKAHLADGQDAQ